MDVGGLLRQWLNDYLESLKTKAVNISHLIGYTLSDELTANTKVSTGFTAYHMIGLII